MPASRSDPKAIGSATLPGQLPQDLFSAGLALSAFVVIGNLFQAVESPGGHPARRFVVGGLLLALGVGAFSARRRLLPVLRDKSWLVICFAALQLALASLDDLLHGPWFAYCLTSVGMAVIVARTRTVLLCALLLGVGYAAVVFSQHAPARLAEAGDLGSAVGALGSVLAAALVLLGLRWLTNRYVTAIVRDGVDPPLLAQQPAVRRLLAAAGERPPAEGLPPWGLLTTAERRSVEGLARYGMSRRISPEVLRAESTVDDDLSRARKKLGCRTRVQMAALTAHPQWPWEPDDAA